MNSLSSSSFSSSSPSSSVARRDSSVPLVVITSSRCGRCADVHLIIVFAFFFDLPPPPPPSQCPPPICSGMPHKLSAIPSTRCFLCMCAVWLLGLGGGEEGAHEVQCS